MSKISIKSTKPSPFKSGLKTDKFEIDAITNPQKRIVSFSLTVKGKVKVFEVKSGDIDKAWNSLLQFAVKNKLFSVAK